MKKFAISIVIIIILSGAIFTAYKIWNDKKTENSSNNSLIQVEEQTIPILYIDNIIKEDNIKIIGTMYTGEFKINDQISIVGLGKKEVTGKIKGLEVEQRKVEKISSGEKAVIELDLKITKEMIQKGQAVILSGTTKPTYNIRAKIIDTELDIGSIKEKGNVFYINSDISCTIKEVSEEGKIKISLDMPMAIENGIECKIKNNSEVIATAIIEDI